MNIIGLTGIFVCSWAFWCSSHKLHSPVPRAREAESSPTRSPGWTELRPAGRGVKVWTTDIPLLQWNRSQEVGRQCKEKKKLVWSALWSNFFPYSSRWCITLAVRFVMIGSLFYASAKRYMVWWIFNLLSYSTILPLSLSFSLPLPPLSLTQPLWR